MNVKIRTCQACANPHPHPALDSRAEPGESAGPGGRSRWASTAGFTLVETVVATLIAGIVLPTLYAGLAMGFSIVKVAREDLRATQIMVQRMEAIRLSPYKMLQSATAYPTNSIEYYDENDKASGAGGVAYTVTYNWAPGPGSLPPSYRSNIVLVTVAASWRSGKVTYNRSMQSYVGRYGIQRYVSGN